MLSLQQMFNIAATGMLTQGRQSMSGDGSCRYRGTRNDKCAVGFIIRDDVYTSLIEGVGVAHGNEEFFGLQKCLALEDVLLRSGVDINDTKVRDLLTVLQKLHDNSDVATWAEKLYNIALHCNLDPLVVTEFQLSHPRDRHAAGMVLEVELPPPARFLATEVPDLR